MKRAVPYTQVLAGTILWSLATSVLLIVFIGMVYENHLFKVSSRSVQGLITSKYVKVSHGKGGPSYTYRVIYQYDAGSLHITSGQSVQEATWAQMPNAGAVSIKYLVHAPTWSRVNSPYEDRANSRDAFILFVMESTVLLAGATWLTLTMRRNKVWERLIRNGESCLGKITSVETENPSGKRIRVYLKFSFQNNEGMEVEGRTWDLPTDQEGLWREGNPIRVYYDAANSGRFTVDLDGSTLAIAGRRGPP